MSHSASSITWTREQKLGITTVGSSLLVSAAAGSGKTAMLAARCAHLVCDADDPCDVDELLVVTFTETAAAEMKSRINAAIRERARDNPSDRLSRQVALIDQAQVSTLHGFCSRLLRQQFHLVGLDPAFQILDADEAKLLRIEIARQLFRSRYEAADNQAFQRFIDLYGEGDDERLIRRVIDTYELLCSLVDPAGWITSAHQRIEEAAGRTLKDTALGDALKASIRLKLTSLRDRCDAALEQIRRLDGFAKYERIISELGMNLRNWREAFESDGIDALAEVVNDAPPLKLPPLPSSLPDKELAKSIVEAIREEMFKGPLSVMLRFTAAQWQEGLENILPHAKVFLELVEQFGSAYKGAKQNLRSLDFADLERLTLKVLRDESSDSLAPSAAARICHDRFRHVLVDEYQDINEVQDAILTLVSRECLGDAPKRGRHRPTPNLFCVGDVKQSIYRFRLAEPARFLRRMEKFRQEEGKVPVGQVIDLRKNFRSRAPLLEAINAVFERLMTRSAADIEYDASHHLAPGKVFPAPTDGSTFAGAPIELHLLPANLASPGGDEGADCADEGMDLDRIEREALLAAQRIRQILGMPSDAADNAQPTCPPMQVMEPLPDGSLRPRPARFSDIVILLRSLRFKAEQFSRILEQSGIPTHTDSSTGYFESMEIRDMLALLQVLDNPRQDIPLAAVLRSPVAAMPNPQDAMARVRLAYPAGPGAIAFHEAVVRYAIEQGDELAAGLRDFLAQLNGWRELAQRRPLDELIRTVYQESGYLAFCSGLSGGEQRVANLLYLHERAAQFGMFQRQGLSRFMQYLASLRDESDLGMPCVAGEADNVVRVMSVHRAKGLEFPIVILPDLGKAINIQDCHGPIFVDREAGLGLMVIDDGLAVRYPSLASTLVRERLRQQVLAEELRVLYVAMTRAREHLICIGACREKSPAAWQNRWGTHRGALPSDSILGAGCMLDWLGPVAAATGADAVFRTKVYSHEEVAAWPAPGSRRPRPSARLLELARLQPLDPAPPRDSEAEAVIRRLSFRYPYLPFTRVPAAESVTTRSKSVGATVSAEAASWPPRVLERPKFLATETALTATEKGTATHLVLQHLDFSRLCDRNDLQAQIGQMIDRRVLRKLDSEAVDLDAVEWFVQTQVGQLVRRHHTTLLRELPVYFPVDPELPEGALLSADPLDRIMVRGRLDLVINLPERSVIIDYKTDAVGGDNLHARADLYRPRMHAYRNAFARIRGRPVTDVLLVFLAARQVVNA